MVQSITCKRAAQHKNPTPNAAVHNGMLATSAIIGTDLETGLYPEDKAEQTALVFQYLEAILEDAGATLDDVLKVDFFLTDRNDRALINEHWLRLWPDPDRRPARQVHQAVLSPGCILQATALAVLKTPQE